MIWETNSIYRFRSTQKIWQCHYQWTSICLASTTSNLPMNFKLSICIYFSSLQDKKKKNYHKFGSLEQYKYIIFCLWKSGFLKQSVNMVVYFSGGSRGESYSQFLQISMWVSLGRARFSVYQVIITPKLR